MWRELEAFARQHKPLSKFKGAPLLTACIMEHYKHMLPANCRGEEFVKAWKNLTPQAAANQAGAELRMMLSNRKQPDPFGEPDMPRLKAIRRKLGHNKRNRAKPKRRPPCTPLPEVVWEGYDSAEESGDEIEDYDWEEGDEEGAGEEGGEQGGEEGHEEDEEGEDEDEDEDEDDAEEAEEDDGEEGEEGEDEARARRAKISGSCVSMQSPSHASRSPTAPHSGAGKTTRRRSTSRSSPPRPFPPRQRRCTATRCSPPTRMDSLRSTRTSRQRT